MWGNEIVGTSACPNSLGDDIGLQSSGFLVSGPAALEKRLRPSENFMWITTAHPIGNQN